LFDEKELKATLKKINEANEQAELHASSSSDTERALIDAVQVRVPKGLDEAAFQSCNEEYAEAMKGVYERFPDDLDVASLYADSLVCLSAWNLWDLKTGEPTPGSRSLEAKSVLEKAMRQDGSQMHPGVLHLYIHLMEMSATPEVALVCADHLRHLTPDGGHLLYVCKYRT
jgi:hypothetical protein